MDRITEEVRMANWQPIIERCQARPAGQSARQWLIENRIPEKQYYYWLRKFRIETYDKQKAELAATVPIVPAVPVFAEVPIESITESEPAPTPAVVIRTKKSTIEISGTVSESLMLQLVKAVRHAI